MPAYDLYPINEYFQYLARGDAEAFKTIFELYKKKVFGVALRMIKSETEAEEIVQEVFLSIWLAKEKLSHVKDPEAYLFTITYHTIYTHLKKVSRNQHLINSIIDNITLIQNTTEETVLAHESGKLIHKAIQQLPKQQRKIFQLNKLEELSYEEIAERMHISRNTVRNHLAEAMKTIRSFFKKAALMFMLLS